MGYVYVIGNGGDEYKIGFTDGNVEKRLATLQSGSPLKLTVEFVISTIGGASRLEGEIHKKLEAKRVRGEWFRLDEIDLAMIRDQYHGRNTMWDDLVALEPRLAALLVEAKSWHQKSKNTPEFCANRIWYSYGNPRGLRQDVISLVGWSAKHDDRPAPLATSLAYDTAYEMVYNALPDCRHEGWC